MDNRIEAHTHIDCSVTFHVEPRLRTCKNAVGSWPSDDRPVDVRSLGIHTGNPVRDIRLVPVPVPPEGLPMGKEPLEGPIGERRMSAPSGMDTKPSASEMPHSQPPICVTWNVVPPNKNDGDLHGDLYSAGHDGSSNGDKINSPMMVMTMKYQLLSMHLKMFSLRSIRREFTKLKIWAKTNLLKTTVGEIMSQSAFGR